MSLHRSATISLLGVAALIGCNPPAPTVSRRTATPFPDTPTTPVKPTAGAGQALGADAIAMDLANADYVIGTTSSGKAALKDGSYEEIIPDSSSKNVVRLGPNRAYGDLDGDGAEDAAVTLLATSGGSGNFSYLAAVLNKNGAAEPLVSVLLGDRINMKSMRIADGQIQVTWLDRRPDEPMSAIPRTEIRKNFVVQNRNVVAVDGIDSEQLRGEQPRSETHATARGGNGEESRSSKHGMVLQWVGNQEPN